jgi:Rrf2 family transcriptional regulator, iron-sulfur cluster assembly transcription factor
LSFFCINRIFVHVKMFSKACQYAVRAIVYIATHSQQGRCISLREIAREINSPEAFTAKILQQLVRSGLINSVKGPNGGFDMDKRQLNRVKLSQVVYAIDGDSIYRGCGLGLPECSEREPCPVHDKFKIIRNELRAMLEKTTIQELSQGLTAGLTFLKR